MRLCSELRAEWDCAYAYGKPMRLMSVSNLSLAVDSTAGYDTWGNMRKYALQDVAYELNFNTENRLASVKVGTAQPTVFAYDADGQRVMTTQPDGTIIYTPFPDYEVTDPPTGSDTVRTTYRLGGQIVAVQTKVGAAASVFYFTYTDHLGNISAMSTTAGVYVTDSRAWYDPFGAFMSDPTANPPDANPVPSSNPSISNHGFTGHRHNNTGTNDLGLIYMNARYYMPEVGRFISPDTIVPEPGNPQSYNRYSYTQNNPMNFTDPTGHREIGADESDLLPHQAPTTTPTLSDVLSPIEPIFDGLPITNIQWTNGFGANSFAYQNAGVYANQSAGIHPGIDFGKNYIDGCDECMTVYANVTGTVVIGVFPGDANPNVVIDLGNGMFVVYGHVHTTIAPGTFVQPGTPIGRLEDQREWSGDKVTRDNTHVHMSLRAAQRTFNPAYFFTDQSILRDFTWNYSPHHSLYSISSYQYTSGKSYWTDPGWTFGLTK